MDIGEVAELVKRESKLQSESGSESVIRHSEKW